MKNLIEKAKEYAIDCHDITAHQYDGKPYDTHLQMVVDAAQKFIYLIPEEYRDIVIASCWVHDVIEDCRQTYNDVVKATNKDVAEIAYALTNEKGKNRKERANAKYYKGIVDTPFADFVKICDRIANYKYSKDSDSRMVDLYKKEMYEFQLMLYRKELEPMFDYLNEIK